MEKEIKIGDRLGIITILDIKGRKVTGLCDCSNIFTDTYVRYTTRKSCGCMAGKHKKHNMRGTQFYMIWKGLNNRCTCKSNSAYSRYGALGIKSHWNGDFQKFYNEMYSSYQQHVQKYGSKNTSIDRINNAGDYCKENCRWATREVQANNKNWTVRVKYKGKILNLNDLCKLTKVRKATIRSRLSKGYTVEQAIKDISYKNQYSSPLNKK